MVSSKYLEISSFVGENIVIEQHLRRLMPLAEDVINRNYPDMSMRIPEHFRGIAMILAKELFISIRYDE